MAPQNTDEAVVVEQNDVPDPELEKVLAAGRYLASPAPGEEVVVTGMAGRFPDSDDVYHYRDNLLNKVDMVSCDNRRWEPTHPEIPQRTGKINFIEKFDAGFFGIHYRQAHAMDPMCRQVLERAYEAIVDAGQSPCELRGTNVGVFVGACFSETEKTWFYDKLESPSYGFTGCARSMLAQRISYYFGFKGPSHTVDTACSSSLYALEHAYRAIRMGRCESALVGGTSLCLHPIVSLQFARLGVLSLDGSCKSFDGDANGYARSETVSVIYLQKSKDAKRIYAQVIHAKTNCDGFKEQGITFPSGPMQRQLLEEVYQECGVPPQSIDFLEAHATGTKVGDPEEIMAMDEVFCVGREAPLMVGSIKSNLGHTEPASGLCSVVKVLLGMEMGCILPNINYSHPREGAEALEKGRMVVVTDTTPWPKNGSGIAAVNSFGFGGANCHVIFKRFIKPKINESLPRDNLPRLICASGRTEVAVNFVFDDVAKRTLDAEFVKLLHDVFVANINAHPFRGYTLLSKSGEVARSVKRFDEIKLPLCLVFSEASHDWLAVGNQLFSISLFAASIQKIHNILAPKGLNITDIICSKVPPSDVTSVIVGTIAVQIAIVDILRTLEVTYDHAIGCSTGELTVAYAEGLLTLEQTVTAAYCIGQCYQNLNKVSTASYEVELNKSQILEVFASQLEIVGHNAEKSYTVSGPSQNMDQYISGLKTKGVPVREVKNNSGLHSKYSGQIRNVLLQNLKQIIPKPKQRTLKWITSSVNKEQLASEVAKYASAEYFVNNLLNPVLFYEATSVLPPETVLVGIGAKVSGCGHHVVEMAPVEDALDGFFAGLGQLYETGSNPKIERLYPRVQYPVSLGTPMISPLVKWNHDNDWYVALYKGQEKMKSGERIITFSIRETDWAFMAGHVIDGRNLMPATGYLVLVWETFSMINGRLLSDMQIVFENVRFHRATNIPRNVPVGLILTVQKNSGKFEIAELGTPIVTGRIYIPDDFSEEIVDLPIPIADKSEIRFTSKDIYKELKLRGYNYMGVFRGLKECDLSATKGLVEWTGNWIAFMDNMLQIKLLQEDTRNLYVPTGIERLAIDAKAHLRITKEIGGETPLIPVYVHKETGIIKCGAIELRGLMANSIQRRKAFGEPVLESYNFVPFESELGPEKATKIFTQIFLENSPGLKVRTVELVDDATKPDMAPLGPLVHQALSDQPLIQSEVVVLSKQPLELANITVEDKKLSAEVGTCSIVCGTNIIGRPEVLEQTLTAMKEHGVVISREDPDFNPEVAQKTLTSLVISGVQENENEKLVLLRKPVEFEPTHVIDMSKCDEEYEWLSRLQGAMKNDENMVLYAENEPTHGLLGFFNCLKREPSGYNLRCFLILDPSAPKFAIEHELYAKQLKKGLSVNVYKDGKWGSYKHLLLEKANEVECEHIFNNVVVRGDLSSLRWIQGPLTQKTILQPEKILIHIYCAAVNFRDIMTASGRISNDVITRDRIEQYNVQGFEFSGRDASGRRVMGMIPSGALASMVTADAYITWEIPDEWSMEDAATIPVTYGTVLHGLVMIAQIKLGQSILIHAGTGGIGQAAINAALHFKCNIFTTVGTPEKREWILKNFPQIPESHIGNSRDTSFEQMVHKETNGRGVDIVLNSLSEEKLLASVRCLAPGGKFLEIGKFDLVSNNPVGMKYFSEGRSFHGVMLDAFFVGAPVLKYSIANLITEGLDSGCVKPLSRTIFKEDEVEQAFRFMAAGKHIGKVIIKLREEEPEVNIQPEFRLFKGLPRYYSNPDNVYIICGGLGGFGLELADWFVIRGAKKLVLVSRKGVQNGYQASRIRIWRTYGAKTLISTSDITTKEGCVQLIEEARTLGPIEGIFNLAVILKDALIENQTEENFLTSLGPKAVATKHLDEVSREMVPELKHFVVFSSVVCGRGNAGQTCYGLANSMMERICERRKKDGYPALAIQWGAIGEVGLVAEMQELQTEIEIGGTLQQRISSCMSCMDTFLRQNEPVVSSIVVAEKRGIAGGADNIVDAVKNIMGLRDLKTISLHSTLSELGMDSMMAVEIKQTLEREYEVFLTAQDIRSMTFARLQEIAQEKAAENEKGNGKKEEKEKIPTGIHMLFRYMGDEDTSHIEVMRLPSLIKEKSMAPKVFILPGIEGMASVMEPLASNLAYHAYCLQYPYKDDPEDSIEALAKSLFHHVHDNIPKTTPFTLVGYSYGAVVAMHLASLLEEAGRIGRVIMIDGAPSMFKDMVIEQVPEIENEQLLQTLVLCTLMQIYIPLETVLMHKNEIFNCKTWEDRVKLVLSLAPEGTPHSELYRRRVCQVSYVRFRSITAYKPTFRKLKSMVKLFKPSKPTMENYDEDYKVQELCENPIDIAVYEGHHLTIVQNPQVAYAINTIIDTSSSYFKQSIMLDKPEAENLKEVSVKQI